MSIDGVVGLADLNQDVRDNTNDIWADTMQINKETADALYKKADDIRNKTRWDGIFGAIGAGIGAIGSLF